MEHAFIRCTLAHVPRLSRGCFTAKEINTSSDSSRRLGRPYPYFAEFSRFGKLARQKEPVLGAKCLSDPVFLSYIQTYRSHAMIVE